MPLNIGDSAPDFSGADVLTGVTHNLSDYSGKTVVLIFSGPSWCGPCILEAPVLQDLWENNNWTNVQFLMVSCFGNETPEAYKQAVQNFGFTFPCLLNPNQATTTLYQVQGVPTLYVINKDMVVCDVKVGASPPVDVLYKHIYEMIINCGGKVTPELKGNISKWRAVMTILFGVTGDGGGLGITPGGKPIPIDPWDPLRIMQKEKRDILYNMAIAELADGIADHRASKAIKSAALKSAESSVKKITAQASMKTPDVTTGVELNKAKK